MDKIELRKVSSLKDHPKNKDIFGDVRGDSDLLDKIKASIVEMGLQEPVIIKQDGTVLSGHIRLAAFQDLLELDPASLPNLCEETRSLLKKKMVPVRVHEDFESAGAEVDYLILSNVLRRQLEPSARNAMFRLLRQRDIEDPLTHKGGRPKKGEGKPGPAQKPKSRVNQFAEATGTTVRHLNREDEVFTHPLVDDEIRQLIDTKVYTVTEVFDALNLMIVDMAREGKDPTTQHLIIALQNPQEKPVTTSYGDVVRKAAGLEPAPKAEPVEEPEAEEPEAEEPEPPPAPKPKAKPVPKPKPVVEPEPEPTVPEVREPEATKAEVRRAEDTLISVGEKIALARKSFEKLLGEADLSELTKTELLGLHKRLSGFLEALGLLSKPEPTPGLPTRLEDQLALFTEVIEDVGEVEDPMAVRDLLLSLSMKAKTSANRLTQVPKTFQPNGLFCPECFSPQVTTPSGDVCENGHGGLYGVTKAQMIQAKAAREEPKPISKVEEPKPKVEAVPPPKPKVDDPDDFSGILEGMTFESADDAPTPSVPPPPKVEPQVKKSKALPETKGGLSDIGLDPEDLVSL